MTITISDLLIIIATFSGPLVAVQLTRWLDDLKEQKNRKFQIFNTLMATRAYGTSYGHVEALNRIDVEFSGKKDKEVIDAWKAYHDLLNNGNLVSKDPTLWNESLINLFTDLLYKMSVRLGYQFDKTYIKNMSYSPKRHGEVESEQDLLRKMLVSILDQGSLPINIINFPLAQSDDIKLNNMKAK